MICGKDYGSWLTIPREILLPSKTVHETTRNGKSFRAIWCNFVDRSFFTNRPVKGRMNSLKKRLGLRTSALSATSLLCVLLASAMAPQGLSKGLLKRKPSVVLQASKTLITFPCPPDDHSSSGSCPSTFDFQVALTAIAKDFNKLLLYTYTVAGGRVVGEGSKVTWDLSGAGPGIYAATVEIQDNKKHRALSSVTLKIVNCADCVDCCMCPPILVTCYDEVRAGTPITCKVWVGPWPDPITYEWSALDSSGADLSGSISGRGPSISIPTNGLGGKSVYTKVEVKGLDPSCSPTASSSTVVKP